LEQCLGANDQALEVAEVLIAHLDCFGPFQLVLIQTASFIFLIPLAAQPASPQTLLSPLPIAPPSPLCGCCHQLLLPFDPSSPICASPFPLLIISSFLQTFAFVLAFLALFLLFLSTFIQLAF
jgi:hypothetical protein